MTKPIKLIQKRIILTMIMDHLKITQADNGTGTKLEELGTNIKLFADVSKSFFELLHNPQRLPSFANLGKIDSPAI